MKPLITGFLLTFVFASFPARGDSGDHTLKAFLSKSDLVVTGAITSEPIGINHELGVPNYISEFRVKDVLKGDGSLKDQSIKVNIQRFEMDPKDKHPLIKKDGECILFLKNAAPNTPSWVTADFWFGVQYPSPWMARSLKRLAAEEGLQTEAVPAEGNSPDPIEQLVAKLSATHGLWVNGRSPIIRLPEPATPEQILEQVFKMTGFDKGHVKDFKILQSRDVQITGGSYSAALVQTDLCRKIVLFTAGGAWSRVYDADEPAKGEPPLSKEAQTVLNGLNLKAADSAWQSAIEMIERPETRPPNTVDSGEVTAFLSGSKKRLADLGVRVAWNTASKRYEVAADNATEKPTPHH